eukprot:903915-Prymnesium_polylepis.1
MHVALWRGRVAPSLDRSCKWTVNNRRAKPTVAFLFHRCRKRQLRSNRTPWFFDNNKPQLFSCPESRLCPSIGTHCAVCARWITGAMIHNPPRCLRGGLCAGAVAMTLLPVVPTVVLHAADQGRLRPIRDEADEEGGDAQGGPGSSSSSGYDHYN